MPPPLPRCSGWAHSSLKLAHPYHFHLAATHGESGFEEWLRQQGPLQPTRGDRGIEGLLKGEDYVYYDDALQADDFATEFLEQLKIAGIRTVLTVPLRLSLIHI